MIECVQQGDAARTGLAFNHPLVRFANDPGNIEAALALDDSVFWGTLPMLADSQDPLIKTFSQRLWHRRLLKCIDVRQEIIEQLDIRAGVAVRTAKDVDKVVDRIAVSVHEAFEDWTDSQESEVPRLLIDQAARHPYKGFQESTEPLSQINIRQGDHVFDIAEASPLIAGLRPFKLFRVYYDPRDTAVSRFISQTILQKIQEKK